MNGGKERGIYFEAQITLDVASSGDDLDIMVMLGHVNGWRTTVLDNGNIYYKCSDALYSYVKERLDAFMKVVGESTITHQRIVRVEWEKGNPL